ncbi:MAG TPA: hypothetical protein VGI40_16600 [Pirellulaceae bacterium]
MTKSKQESYPAFGHCGLKFVCDLVLVIWCFAVGLNLCAFGLLLLAAVKIGKIRADLFTPDLALLSGRLELM